jgi:basic amino acid/polyamine antiporter, APA family
MKLGLFAKKSISGLLKEAADNKHGLKKSLSAMNLITMGIGAIVGAGLFVITGTVAANFAGPGVVFSFILAAIIALLSALCYAEFASLIPIAGSAYTYVFVTIGEFFAWIMGTALIMEYFCSFSTVAVGWSGYMKSFLADLGCSIPSKFASAPLDYVTDIGWVSTGSIINLPAMIIIGLVGWLVSRGIQGAALLNNVLVIVKLGVIFVFIILGFSFVKSENLFPVIPQNLGKFGEFGWSGVLRGAGVVFFAFLGFDAVATLAQEAKKPQKDLPIGMLGSLIISTIFYVGFALVLVGVVHYQSLGVADPVGVAIDSFGSKFVFIRYIVKFSILVGLSSVILVMMAGLSRILYTMAHDGLLPKIFSKIHPKYRTPFYTTWICCVCSMVVVGFFPVGILGQLTSMGALFVFAMVCFGVLVLRFVQPALHRPFKTPFTPYVPLAGTVFCLIMMFAMPLITWIQFVVFLLLGCVVYRMYGSKHSKIRNVGRK